MGIETYRWILTQVPADFCTNILWFIMALVAAGLCGVLAYYNRHIVSVLLGLYAAGSFGIWIISEVVSASDAISNVGVLGMLDIVPIIYLAFGIMMVVFVNQGFVGNIQTKDSHGIQ